MKVTRSHIKDALKKCPFHGTSGQEKNEPLEYAIEFRGSLADDFTTKDLEPDGRLAESCGQWKVLIQYKSKRNQKLQLIFLTSEDSLRTV